MKFNFFRMYNSMNVVVVALAILGKAQFIAASNYSPNIGENNVQSIMHEPGMSLITFFLLKCIITCHT